VLSKTIDVALMEQPENELEPGSAWERVECTQPIDACPEYRFHVLRLAMIYDNLVFASHFGEQATKDALIHFDPSESL